MFHFFNTTQKRKILVLFVVQTFLGILDILGLLLVGVVSNLVLNISKGISPGAKISGVLEFLNIESWNSKLQSVSLGILIISLLTTKSVLSLYFSKKILKYLAILTPEIQTKYLNKLFTLKINEIQKFNNSELSKSLLNIGAITNSISNLSYLLSDIILFSMIFVALIIVDPISAFINVLFLGSLSIIFALRLKDKNYEWAKKRQETAIVGDQVLFDAVSVYREIYVGSKLQKFSNKISEKWREGAINEINISLVPVYSKLIYELAILVSVSVLCIYQFLSSTVTHAITTLSIFFIATMRIIPAISRIQNSFLTLNEAKGRLAIASSLLNSIETASQKHKSNLDTQILEINEPRKSSGMEIRLSNVSFKYNEDSNFELYIPELVLPEKQTFAIVGSSGCGKSTLIDLILGLLSPNTGEVTIGGVVSNSIYSSNPGTISYVSQTGNVIIGTIRENLLMGSKTSEYSDSKLLDILQMVGLKDFILSLNEQLNTKIGPGGVMLSAGQRQRISIARALLPNPKILVLDEASSNLDAETENILNSFLKKIQGSLTILIIAHRLNSVKMADAVLYMENGKILQKSDFETLKSLVPAFDRQVKLFNL